MTIDIKKDFRVVDFQPVASGDGDGIVFTYKGTRFVYEVWSAGGANGRDYYGYDAAGNELTPERLREVLWDRNDSEEVDKFLNEVYDIWLEQKERLVHPAWEAAVQNTLIGVWDTVQMNDPNDPDSP